MAPIPCFRSGSQGIFAPCARALAVQSNHRKLLGLSVNSLDIPMVKPTLTQVFGAGAAQTSTSLTIQKADLAAVGLTADAADSAESLVVALLLKWKEYLNSTNRDANLDQVVYLEDGFASLTTRNNQEYQQRSITCYFEKVNANVTIDPDDY